MRPPTKTLLYTVITTCFLFTATGCGKSEPKGSGANAPAYAPPAPPKSEEEKAREIVAEWLGDLKRGETGDHHWRATYGIENAYGSKPRLYSVRAYEILSTSVSEPTGETAEANRLKKLIAVTVRIDSSNSAGSHITKTYRVRVGYDGTSVFILGAG